MKAKGKERLTIAIVAVTFLWCGLLVGISFLEAPLKFKAPHVTTEIGVGIGKLVFTALNRIELGLAAFVLVALALRKEKLKTWFFFGVPVDLLVAQTIFLLPPLHQRVALIQAGIDPPASSIHLWFIVCEVVKLLSLIVAGCWFLRKELGRTSK